MDALPLRQMYWFICIDIYKPKIIFSISPSFPTGGSLSGDLVTDEELFIRWLEIAAFLPVISFHTPPWVCGEDQVRCYNSLQTPEPVRARFHSNLHPATTASPVSGCPTIIDVFTMQTNTHSAHCTNIILLK